MIPVTHLRTGSFFKDNGEVFEVLHYSHKKLGRGQATIRVRIRSLKTGAVLEKAFHSGSKLEETEVEKRPAQYLYKTQNFVFMDPKSFEQFEVREEVLAGKEGFLKEGEKVEILFFEGKPVSVELPVSLILEVKETGPGVKGDSATNIFKPAILENGLKVKVPLFIKVGDMVKVDTRTEEYVERAK